ncbi:unnamed protein product, partial [Discosporangium mesarthrocarpum]
GTQPSADGIPVISTTALDAAALNTRIRTMTPAGQKQRLNPVSLVHELIGGSEETPRMKIDQQADPIADFNRVSVTIIRDGFQDDSVRGDWHRFLFSRRADGSWAVLEARRAYRCYRGRTDIYRAELCA